MGVASIAAVRRVAHNEGTVVVALLLPWWLALPASGVISRWGIILPRRAWSGRWLATLCRLAAVTPTVALCILLLATTSLLIWALFAGHGGKNRAVVRRKEIVCPLLVHVGYGKADASGREKCSGFGPF